jgi:hypothetical protein
VQLSFSLFSLALPCFALFSLALLSFALPCFAWLCSCLALPYFALCSLCLALPCFALFSLALLSFARWDISGAWPADIFGTVVLNGLLADRE